RPPGRASRPGRRPRLGPAVSFRRSVASPVVLSMTKRGPGKKLGRRCLAPTPARAKARACTRTITLPGRITRQGTAGLNTIRFSGRIGGKALAPGPYALVLTLPKSGTARAVVLSRAFRVLPWGAPPGPTRA